MRISYVLIVFISLLAYCSTNPITADNGGTTEITNAKVLGYIYALGPDKDTVPVSEASVILRSPGKENRVTSTNQAGLFYIDTVDSGTYWLEAKAADTIGLVTVIEIHSGDTLHEMHTILKYMGGVQGKIEVDTSQYDPDSVYKTTVVSIPEIERQLSVDMNGIFKDTTLPPFENYTIQIENSIFPILSDTLKVGVKEKEITHLDNTNTPPIFTHDETAMNNIALFGEEYRDTVHAIDPDGDSLNFVLLNGPMHLFLSDSIVIWTPTMNCDLMNSPHHVSVQVFDNKGGYAILDWGITVVQKK